MDDAGLAHLRPDVSGLIEVFKKKAKQCYAEYRSSRDPCEAAAASVYDECAAALADALAGDDAGNCPNTISKAALDKARLDENGNIVIDLRTEAQKVSKPTP